MKSVDGAIALLRMGANAEDVADRSVKARAKDFIMMLMFRCGTWQLGGYEKGILYFMTRSNRSKPHRKSEECESFISRDRYDVFATAELNLLASCWCFVRQFML